MELKFTIAIILVGAGLINLTNALSLIDKSTCSHVRHGEKEACTVCCSNSYKVMHAHWNGCYCGEYSVYDSQNDNIIDDETCGSQNRSFQDCEQCCHVNSLDQGPNTSWFGFTCTCKLRGKNEVFDYIFNTDYYGRPDYDPNYLKPLN